MKLLKTISVLSLITIANADPLKTAPRNGIWKTNDMCWTTKIKNSGTPFNKINLKKCSPEWKTENRKAKTKKTQSWEFVNGKIRTTDGMMCITVKKPYDRKRPGATRCSLESSDFKLLDDGQISMIDKPICLILKQKGKKLGIGKCDTVNVAPTTTKATTTKATTTKATTTKATTTKATTIYKSAHVGYSPIGNMTRIMNIQSKMGQFQLIKENWNYYTLKMNKVHRTSNFGVAPRAKNVFEGKQYYILGYGKIGLGCYTEGTTRYMFSALTSTGTKMFQIKQSYGTGSFVKVILTDTYVEFRCISCGDTVIYKHVFKTGDYKDLYPALDLHALHDSYDMTVY